MPISVGASKRRSGADRAHPIHVEDVCAPGRKDRALGSLIHPGCPGV